MPVLKYVRGEPLSTDHWMELFRMVKMPKGTTLEKLIFADVLNACDEIILHRDDLKVCCFQLNSRREKNSIVQLTVPKIIDNENACH